MISLTFITFFCKTTSFLSILFVNQVPSKLFLKLLWIIYIYNTVPSYFIQSPETCWIFTCHQSNFHWHIASFWRESDLWTATSNWSLDILRVDVNHNEFEIILMNSIYFETHHCHQSYLEWTQLYYQRSRHWCFDILICFEPYHNVHWQCLER